MQYPIVSLVSLLPQYSKRCYLQNSVDITRECLLRCCITRVSARTVENLSELARTLKESFKLDHNCTGEVFKK